MTREEYIEQCLKQFEKNPEEDSVDNLIALAYIMGREDEAYDDIRAHNNILAEQRKRAEDHRFKNYGAYIVGSGKETFIYSKYYNKKKYRNLYGKLPVETKEEQF